MLREAGEIHGALAALSSDPAFLPCCNTILAAAHGWGSSACSPEATPQLQQQAYTPPSNCSEQTAGAARGRGTSRTALHLR